MRVGEKLRMKQTDMLGLQLLQLWQSIQTIGNTWKTKHIVCVCERERENQRERTWECLWLFVMKRTEKYLKNEGEGQGKTQETPAIYSSQEIWRSEDLNPDNHAFYPSRGKTEATDRVPIASRQLPPLATPAQAKGETQ